MTIQYTSPVMNHFTTGPAKPGQQTWPEAIRELTEKYLNHKETPYASPSLNNAIEQEYTDPVAANYAKLGIPYNGDPAADNEQRLGEAKNMFSDGNELINNGGETPYQAPDLTANIARDYARRGQQPAYAGAGGGACDAGGCGPETPYITPTLF